MLLVLEVFHGDGRSERGTETAAASMAARMWAVARLARRLDAGRRRERQAGERFGATPAHTSAKVSPLTASPLAGLGFLLHLLLTLTY